MQPTLVLDSGADMNGNREILNLPFDGDLNSVVRLAQNLPNFMWFDGGNTLPSLLLWGKGKVVLDSPSWQEDIRASIGGAGCLKISNKRYFSGGLAGIWGYEFGARCEEMPPPSTKRPHPDLYVRRYEGGLTFEPSRNEFVAAGSSQFVRSAKELLMKAQKELKVRSIAEATMHVESPDDAEFVSGVERILGEIEAGGCYQVNLSRRLVFSAPAAPLETYIKLRECHPAEMGAYITMPNGFVLSNSPELFLKLVGRSVETRPIKGTRPRTGNPAADEAARTDLESSEKEIAELTMITDLARNDLSRVAAPGTVVCDPRRVFPLPTLFHAEQRVTCTLRESLDVVDLIEATFPPASVTGAPKVQAMKTIQELEPVSRGVYTGAIGWISDHGDAMFSVAIRTLSVHGDSAYLHLGSGIVADSDPHCELEESKWKGAAIIKTITGA